MDVTQITDYPNGGTVLTEFAGCCKYVFLLFYSKLNLIIRMRGTQIIRLLVPICSMTLVGLFLLYKTGYWNSTESDLPTEPSKLSANSSHITDTTPANEVRLSSSKVLIPAIDPFGQSSHLSKWVKMLPSSKSGVPFSPSDLHSLNIDSIKAVPFPTQLGTAFTGDSLLKRIRTKSNTDKKITS